MPRDKALVRAVVVVVLLTLVGAVVGGLVGYPGWGAAIGFLLGCLAEFL